MISDSVINQSSKKGLSFGSTSGIITTLGLMVGLHSSTHSTLVVVGGILVIAIADALSDAMGIHISEEAENQHTTREIWEATISTFLSKFVFALMFLVPIFIFSLTTAIIVSVVLGLLLIAVFSYFLAKQQNIKPSHVIFEHLTITIIAVLVTHFIGDWVATFG